MVRYRLTRWIFHTIQLTASETQIRASNRLSFYNITVLLNQTLHHVDHTHISSTAILKINLGNMWYRMHPVIGWKLAATQWLEAITNAQNIIPAFTVHIHKCTLKNQKMECWLSQLQIHCMCGSWQALNGLKQQQMDLMHNFKQNTCKCVQLYMYVHAKHQKMECLYFNDSFKIG